MSNIRMKIAAGATILGLGGLAGYAISSNDAAGAPPATKLTAAEQAPEPQVHTQVIRRTVHLRPKGEGAGSAQAAGAISSTSASSPPVPVAPATPVALRSNSGTASAAVVTGSSGSGSGGDDDRDEYEADDDGGEFEDD